MLVPQGSYWKLQTLGSLTHFASWRDVSVGQPFQTLRLWSHCLLGEPWGPVGGDGQGSTELGDPQCNCFPQGGKAPELPWPTSNATETPWPHANIMGLYLSGGSLPCPGVQMLWLAAAGKSPFNQGGHEFPLTYTQHTHTGLGWGGVGGQEQGTGDCKRVQTKGGAATGRTRSTWHSHGACRHTVLNKLTLPHCRLYHHGFCLFPWSRSSWS